MKLYNSKSLQVEEFKPINEGEVKMYVCGPTVYNDVHIGNVRPVVVFDTLRRTFEALGYKVYYVSNYTDVDDKIIKEAKKRGISEKELTDEMIAAYNDIRHRLNAQDLYATPRVTETVDDIIAFIEELVKKGAAYKVDGDVFFRVSSVGSYGSLSNQSIDELKVGARIDENEKKESPLDFVLWKKTDEGIRWDTPFSIGRPGWHTECVVMINSKLGDKIDIHGGGKDLRFPHHENERAQSIACNGSELANYWMHSGMIDINGIKMSKSLGNFITAKDILKTTDPSTLRWFLLETHYRADVNVSDEIIAGCKKELSRVLEAIKKSDIELALNDIKDDYKDEDSYKAFLDAMSDDLNTPNAYAVIFDLVKKINSALRNKEKDYHLLTSYKNSLIACLDILGIPYQEIKMSEEDKALFKEWQIAKEEKNFEHADDIRTLLQGKGLL